MSNKAQHAEWTQRKELARCGIGVKESAVRLHNKRESPKHLVLKALLARELQKNDRPFDTEVEIDGRGRVDVLDLGDYDEPPVAYEIQTNATKKEIDDKRKRYVDGTPLRDVIPLDPTDAPDDVDGIIEYLRSQVGGI